MPTKSILNFRTIAPFFYVALGWLTLGIGICFFKSARPNDLFLNIFWVVDIWLLSLLDLLAIAKASASWITLKANEPTGPLYVQALFWGVIKLICLGLFGIVLLKGQSIPNIGLLVGFGTLGIVPIFGGFWWSQRESREASHA